MDLHGLHGGKTKNPQTIQQGVILEQSIHSCRVLSQWEGGHVPIRHFLPYGWLNGSSLQFHKLQKNKLSNFIQIVEKWGFECNRQEGPRNNNDHSGLVFSKAWGLCCIPLTSCQHEGSSNETRPCRLTDYNSFPWPSLVVFLPYQSNEGWTGEVKQELS